MKQKLKIVALILAVAACAIAAIGGTVLVGRLAERLFDAWTAPPPKPHTFAATPIQGPPNPVYLADGVTSSANLLGIAGNPMAVTTVGSSGGGGSSSNILASTGTTPAAGLVAKSSAGVIQSTYVYNSTAVNCWLVIANQTAAVSAFTGIGTPYLVPAGYAVVLGTDFFGTSGWSLSTGISLGMTSTRNGAYTSCGATSSDIQVNGL